VSDRAADRVRETVDRIENCHNFDYKTFTRAFIRHYRENNLVIQPHGSSEIKASPLASPRTRVTAKSAWVAFPALYSNGKITKRLTVAIFSSVYDT